MAFCNAQAGEPLYARSFSTERRARGAGLKAPRVSQSEPLCLCRHRMRKNCSRLKKPARKIDEASCMPGAVHSRGFQYASTLEFA